jgi:hypothetical protein
MAGLLVQNTLHHHGCSLGAKLPQVPGTMIPCQLPLLDGLLLLCVQVWNGNHPPNSWLHALINVKI